MLATIDRHQSSYWNTTSIHTRAHTFDESEAHRQAMRNCQMGRVDKY